jgi:RNA polymerase sigma-70 factor (ECF subfamily)
MKATHTIKTNTIKNMKTYNKSAIMKRAWVLFRNSENLTFGEALKQSWNIAKNGMKEVNFDAVYKKYFKQIYFYILEKVSFKSDIAENLTQDTFVKVFKHLENYEVEKSALNTWIHRIALNTVIDSVRTSHADKFVSVDNFVDAETGKETFQVVDNSQADLMETQQVSEKINSAMSNLKPKYKAIADLYFVQEKNYNEIAEILSVPLGTVKGMISRTREMLQSQLREVREMI